MAVYTITSYVTHILLVYSTVYVPMQWSYGVTVWEIFNGGRTPYPAVNPLSLIQLLGEGQRLERPPNTACATEMWVYWVCILCVGAASACFAWVLFASPWSRLQLKGKDCHVIYYHSIIIMPRCACASEVYSSVFVYLCVCVCRLVYSCSRINQVQVRVFIGFYSHVFLLFVDLQNNALFSSHAYLECYCSLFRRVPSKTCLLSVATLLSS